MLLSWLLATSLAQDGTVTIDGEIWRRLMSEPVEVPETGFRPAATRRIVTLEERSDGIAIRVTWTLEAQEAGWFSANLVDKGVLVDRVLWNGSEAPISTDPSAFRVTGFVDRPVEIVLEGTLTGDPSRGAVGLGLLPAATGVVEVTDELQVGDAVRVDGRYWSGDAALRIEPRRVASRGNGNLVNGLAAVGMTVGDSEMQGRARVEWRVRRGSLQTVSLKAPGVGSDLRVTGAQVSSWKRVGERVEIVLTAPETQRVTADLTWSERLPARDTFDLAVPILTLDGVLRTERTLQIARDSEVEVASDLVGWSSIPVAQLPDWGAGLIEGTSVGAMTATRARPGGVLNGLRFSPAQGPPVMIDLASHTLALSGEGRTLMRSYLGIRNERAAHLRITPPPGAQIVSARVSGAAVTMVSDGSEGVLIPLPRSVETLDGLLSFPLEVVFLGDADALARKEDRELALPSFDAPVAVSRVSVNVPRGWDSILEVGEYGTVEDFTEKTSIDYGFTSEDSSRTLEADALFQEAVQDWMSNDFGEVQDKLDTLKSMGADNTNIQRLESNLRLLDSDDETRDTAQSRRLRAQAQARSIDEARYQAALLTEAKRAEEAGEYEEATRKYETAISIGKKLKKLEAKESVAEQDAREEEVLAEVARVRKKVKSVSKPSRTSDDAPSAPSRDIDAARGTVGGAIGIGGLGTKGSGYGGGGAADAPAPPPEPEEPADDAFAPLDIRATQLDVVIPNTGGETVRYQRTLLPRDASVSVRIRLRRDRSE